MSSVLGSRGQVVIEKPIREALGLEPGYVSVQKIVDQHLEIRFFPPEHDRSLKGVLARDIRRTLDPERWEEIRAEAWAKGARPARPEDDA